MKPLKNAPKKEEDVVYVGIDEPLGLRRDVLEASKSMVKVLKGHHALMDTRAAKQRLIEELRARVAELSELVERAKGLVPVAEVGHSHERAQRPRPGKAPDEGQPAPKMDLSAHTDKLERELEDIEKKLKEL